MNAVSILNVEYLLCEHWETIGDSSHQFKVHPQQFDLKISTPNFTLNNMTLIQFRVNNTRATTGHKLQGVSKNCSFAVDYNYRTQNWIHVILSRVRK